MARVFVPMLTSLPTPLRLVYLLASLSALGCTPMLVPDDAASDDAAMPRDGGVCSGTRILEVVGRVVDETGVPIEDARAQLCVRLAEDDRLVCLVPPRTDARGAFVITVDPEVACMRSGTLRVLVPEGGFAPTYCGLGLTATREGTLTLPTPIEVVRVAPAQPLPPLGDIAETRLVDLGVVTLELAPRALPTPEDYPRLGARAFPPSRSCIPALQSMEGLFLLTPEAELFERASVTLRIPGARLGERFEVHQLGGVGTLSPDGTPLAEGEVGLLGHGTANAEGEVTVDTQLGYLGQLGWRRAP